MNIIDSLCDNYSCITSNTEINEIAIYARTASFDNQKISDQINNCKRFISSQGWSMENVAVYVDNGFPGCDEQRPDFQQMLQDIDAGMYQTLVVDDLNRLSRSSSLSQNIVEKLIQRNIQIFIVSGSFSLSKQNYPYHFWDLMSQISG